MKIDWQTRIKSKKFWLTLIPAVLLLIQTVLVPFGYKWDFGILNQQLTAIINAVFGVLSIIGVVSDPNVKGDE
ncbi:phage holin [Enterococcus cecorum]|uniref:phage holin n=1 Tax=Enterococcus cecorum TaxID=44008 RepID=UPI002ACAC2EE|nr:phage holin [Enterococcus cecorum]MDZ5501879.1 phage holin [Enterococcus cecorum]